MSILSLPVEPQPGSRCIVTGCDRATELRPFFITLDGRVDRAWAAAPLCEEHYDDAVEVCGGLQEEGIPREVAFFWLVAHPERTIERKQRIERAAQLSFADVHGRIGEHWRQTMRTNDRLHAFEGAVLAWTDEAPNPFDDHDGPMRHRLLAIGDSRCYEVYLRSQAWQRLRAQVRQRADERCERCGAQWVGLFPPLFEVHHLTYERIGDESLGDLLLLCRKCHEGAHSGQRLTA